jgi:hypothetical protein
LALWASGGAFVIAVVLLYRVSRDITTGHSPAERHHQTVPPPRMRPVDIVQRWKDVLGGDDAGQLWWIFWLIPNVLPPAGYNTRKSICRDKQC